MYLDNALLRHSGFLDCFSLIYADGNLSGFANQQLCISLKTSLTLRKVSLRPCVLSQWTHFKQMVPFGSCCHSAPNPLPQCCAGWSWAVQAPCLLTSGSMLGSDHRRRRGKTGKDVEEERTCPFRCVSCHLRRQLIPVGAAETSSQSLTLTEPTSSRSLRGLTPAGAPETSRDHRSLL